MKRFTNIRLSKACIGDAEKHAVIGVMDREYLGMGSEVEQFERDLADFFGRPVACVVNGTAALQLAIQACGISQGDEVLVQSLTYIASFQAISAVGAIPIACDVTPDSLTIDWRDAEKRITSKTRAIMPVHYSGGVGDLDEVYKLATQHGLRVIEDAAHAFGTIYKNKRIGGFGDISCFSFDGIKNITSGEGGCIVTQDLSVLKRVQDARLLGVERDTEKRYSGGRSWDFDVTHQGWRYHMSNIMAAIGIQQLKRFSELAERRQIIARQYVSELSTCKNITLLNRNYDEVVPHIFPIILRDGIDRTLVRQCLLKQLIETGIHYQPSSFTSFFNTNRATLPVTENIYNRLLTLPLHPDLEIEDVRRVCNILKAAVS